LADEEGLRIAPREPSDTFRLYNLELLSRNNSARLLEIQRRYPEAEALMRRSLEVKAAQNDVIQHYVHIRQKQCAWPHYLPVGEVTPNQLLMGTSLLATMGLSDDPALQLLSSVRFVNDKVPKPPPVALHTQTPPRSGKIRIGYLSGDLHMHAVGLLTPELFELHDRSRFEIWAFCWTPESAQPVFQRQRQRILKAMDHHVRLAGVDDHVRRGCILHPPARAFVVTIRVPGQCVGRYRQGATPTDDAAAAGTGTRHARTHHQHALGRRTGRRAAAAG
jgi:predicted O-linked N-acetylglucosamine transferase (SPINDLY family)